MDRKKFHPSSTRPEWLHAVMSPRNVTSLGWASDFFISLKRSIALVPNPCKARPVIIELHTTTSFNGIRSKTSRAKTKLPHFAYMSISPLQMYTSFLNLLSDTYSSIHFACSSEPNWATARTEDCIVPSSGRTLFDIISEKRSSASSARPFLAKPEIMEFQRITFLPSFTRSNRDFASSTCPHFAYREVSAICRSGSVSKPVFTANPWMHFPWLSPSISEHALRTLTKDIWSGFTFDSIMPPKILRASTGCPFCARPEITEVHETTFLLFSLKISKTTRARPCLSICPWAAQPYRKARRPAQALSTSGKVNLSGLTWAHCIPEYRSRTAAGMPWVE
ncbi:genome polyprotein [Striga asiatica]|uniref:Genome polyprotein n=1 Tax=Striga asiatica TaxID=4170 RepID=A0A5A7QDW5_STRAF|nr:genome polyprotein [Striga asiatica]